MLSKLDARLDDLDDKLHNLDKTAALQQVSLDEHIRRTNILEKTVIPIKKNFDTVQSYKTLVIKLVSGVAVIAAIYASVRG
jgi:hypothetical protein